MLLTCYFSGVIGDHGLGLFGVGAKSRLKGESFRFRRDIARRE